MLFTVVFFSIEDNLTTPSEPDALLTNQHHKGNQSSTQHTCGGHRGNLECHTATTADRCNILPHRPLPTNDTGTSIPLIMDKYVTTDY